MFLIASAICWPLVLNDATVWVMSRLTIYDCGFYFCRTCSQSTLVNPKTTIGRRRPLHRRVPTARTSLGRVAPSEAAEKPAGEWQTLDITLVNRHVTVVLNGRKILDNQPAAGCTGGALWSDEFIPGPVYFQEDHTGVKYRNIELRPVVRSTS